MSGVEAAAALAAAGVPLVTRGIQEIWSIVEKYSLADLHKELKTELGRLLALQKDKNKEASSGQQEDTSHVYKHWTDCVSKIETQVDSLNEKYEGVKKNKLLQFLFKPRLKKKMKEALKDVTLIEPFHHRLRGFSMTGLEAAIVTGAATAVGAPLVNNVLEELRSRLKKCTSLADLHNDLNKALSLLLNLQREKDREASSRRQQDISDDYRHWTDDASKIKTQVNSLNEKYEKVSKKKFLLPWTKPRLKKKMKEALKAVIEHHEKCPEKIFDTTRGVEKSCPCLCKLVFTCCIFLNARNSRINLSNDY
ncbi:hypothetical protein K1719_021703 [Acacia pycnantha]|nr:hypothetical protein K1719_021703 [Acacia pycnantha]